MQCKKKVWTGNRPRGLVSHQCKKMAVKDGFCKIHHPSEIKKREAHREKRLEAISFNMIHRY